MLEIEGETGEKKRPKRTTSFSRDRRRMCNYFTQYCDVTSIHGFRYLGEQKRSWLEKIWWFITIAISIIICGMLIVQTYYKWERSPVIVSFATKQTPIWQVPFPAVTICPETKSRQSVFNFTDLYLKFPDLNETERKHFDYIAMVCNPRRTKKSLKKATLHEDVLDFFDTISPSFHNVTLQCKWMGKEESCDDLFTPIMTDEGVCYTFNMLDRDEIFNRDMKFFKNYLHHEKSSTEWSLEKGYAKDAKKDVYPRRALFSGATNGLQIHMAAYDMDLDYICGDSLQGYKILLHHPAEIPRVSQQYFMLPLNQAVVAAVKPEMMTTSEELRGYKPTKRKCFFPDERKLRFFKIYTQQNCEIECLTNYTLHKCDCVDFHMPRTNGTPICGPGQLTCINSAEESLLSTEIELKLKEIEEEAQNEEQNGTLVEDIFNRIHKIHDTIAQKEKSSKSECECLPSCTSLRYSTETSQSDWDWVQNFKGLNDPYGFVAANYKSGQRLAHLSKLVLFFKELQFIASERDELYGPIDFLANCGGLLGLFTGFSFISLVEIIYFLSLRWMCNMRKRGKKSRAVRLDE